jgi:hypothetical protein
MIETQSSQSSRRGFARRRPPPGWTPRRASSRCDRATNSAWNTDSSRLVRSPEVPPAPGAARSVMGAVPRADGSTPGQHDHLVRDWDSSYFTTRKASDADRVVSLPGPSCRSLPLARYRRSMGMVPPRSVRLRAGRLSHPEARPKGAVGWRDRATNSAWNTEAWRLVWTPDQPASPGV